jgi:predicted aldo/keto reductase-like oxidoreductase
LDTKHLRALIDADVFDVVQFPYSLVQMEPVDQEILPFAREKNMGTIANFPTINGLAGREWGVFYDVFAGLVDTPGQAALVGILAHPDIDCVLSRLSSPARAEENGRAGGVASSLTPEQRQEIYRRLKAFGEVRFLQRDDCPPAPEGVNFRYGMIHYDLYTRFGYGGARRPVEQFVRQLQAHEDWEWDESVRDLVEQVKRSCPVFLRE